jgi:hypothetical protein
MKPKLHSYRLQLVQKIKCTPKDLREQSTLEMFSHIAEDENYFNRICFSNEAIFCVWKAVNRHNCHAGGQWMVKILMSY